MSFDWRKFLGQHGIEFIDHGPGTAKGNIYVTCPYCNRPNDPDKRMGISLSGKGFGCWRDVEHRGIRPHHLVMALLGCSYQEAAHIVGDSAEALPPVDDRSFAAFINAMLDPPKTASSTTTLSFTPDIRALDSYPLGSRMFLGYLQSRGYTEAEAREIAKRYDLHGALHGRFRYRLIFPIVHEHGLVCWTGRSIIRNDQLRYRSLSDDPEKAKKDKLPQAVLGTDKCLWQAGALAKTQGEVLAVLEGPFDSMRVDYYGQKYGIRATCLFGKVVSESQIQLLDGIAGNFKHRYLVLDQDAYFGSIATVRRLSFLDFKVRTLPPAVKDPALMTKLEIVETLGLHR